jgi:hypothetical protein
MISHGQGRKNWIVTTGITKSSKFAVAIRELINSFGISVSKMTRAGLKPDDKSWTREKELDCDHRYNKGNISVVICRAGLRKCQAQCLSM